MDKFEKWQVIISISQTIILFFTLVSAIYIGVTQNHINENLLNLNYFPSIEVAYTPKKKRLQIYNKGNSNIWLWGTKYMDTKPNIKDKPVLITPNGSYYILAEKFESIVKTQVGKDGETFVPFDLFIEDSNKTTKVC